MFRFLIKSIKKFKGIENEDLINELFKQIYNINTENKFRAKVILQYFLDCIKNDEAISHVFKLMYGGNEKLKKAEEMERVLSLKSALHDVQFVHWSNKKIYTTLGIALPNSGIILEEEFLEVLHTEEEVTIPIYRYSNHMYHNYNDDVLVIYKDDKYLYARPYCMFFGLVEDDGLIKARFEKIVE